MHNIISIKGISFLRWCVILTTAVPNIFPIILSIFPISKSKQKLPILGSSRVTTIKPVFSSQFLYRIKNWNKNYTCWSSEPFFVFLFLNMFTYDGGSCVLSPENTILPNDNPEFIIWFSCWLMLNRFLCFVILSLSMIINSLFCLLFWNI